MTTSDTENRSSELEYRKWNFNPKQMDHMQIDQMSRRYFAMETRGGGKINDIRNSCMHLHSPAFVCNI